MNKKTVHAGNNVATVWTPIIEISTPVYDHLQHLDLQNT